MELCGQEKERKQGIERDGVLLPASMMPEMWKKQRVHENARKMYRAEILVKEFGKMVKATFGRTRYD